MQFAPVLRWESEVSRAGNVASVWEALIQKRKLPFGAMIRNLRSILLAGCARAAHDTCIEWISSQRAVSRSFVSPFQFLQAFGVIQGIAELLPAAHQEAKIEKEKEIEIEKEKGGDEDEKPGRRARMSLADTLRKLPVHRRENVTAAVARRYCAALDTAVKLSVIHNIRPIQGNTLVLADCGAHMGDAPDKYAPGRRMAVELLPERLVAAKRGAATSILLALLIRFRCVDMCRAVVFGSAGEGSAFAMPFRELDTGGGGGDDGSILGCVAKNMNDPFTQLLMRGTGFPSALFDDLCRSRREKFDTVVILSGRCTPETATRRTRESWIGQAERSLRKYRERVNKDVRVVVCDLLSAPHSDQPGRRPRSLDFSQLARRPNDVSVCGFSESILNFIGQGAESQLRYISNLDTYKGIDKTSSSTGGLRPAAAAAAKARARRSPDEEPPREVEEEGPNSRKDGGGVSSEAAQGDAGDAGKEETQELVRGVPKEFFCKMTYDVMRDPVLADDGFVYENAAIAAWLEVSDMSPMTGRALPQPATLRKQTTLATRIAEWRQRKNVPE
jgi:TROVE domain/U-box domain